MGFPKDMIVEFLIRLPVKSLMRFKCVSNEWNDFISDDDFRRRYRSRQKSKGNAPTGFICHGNTLAFGCGVKRTNFIEPWVANNFLYASENYVEKEELKSLNYLNQVGFVISASKGLLLLGQNPRSLYVYDLVSNKSVNLPPKRILLTRQGLSDDFISLGFKCEEKKSGELCYTVLCVATSKAHFTKDSNYYCMEIYTSETGTWRKAILEAETYIAIWHTHTAKVIRGVFHWFENFGDRIIAYDDDLEKTTLIELPPSTNVREVNTDRLKELEGTEDGSLQFININNNNDMMMLNVWILSKKEERRSYMDEDDIVVASRWSLVHSISYWDIGAFCRDLQQKPPRVIGVDPANVNIIYLEIANHIYTYNHHGKVVFASSQQLLSPARVFLHFEWPTWPCL